MQIRCWVPSLLVVYVAEVHHLMYCAALVIVEFCGLNIHPPQRLPTNSDPPAWKISLLSNVKHLQADVSRLHSLKKGQLYRRSTKSQLFVRYNINCDSDIDVACEYVSQKIHAYRCRLSLSIFLSNIINCSNTRNMRFLTC